MTCSAGESAVATDWPTSLFLDVIDKLLYDLKVDVSLEQSQPNGAQRLLHVFFIEGGLAPQGLESALKFF